MPLVARNFLVLPQGEKKIESVRSMSKSFQLAILVIGLVLACSSPAPEPVSEGDPAFRTTDPSRLFFQNVRSASYYLERPKGTALELYRHRRFSQTAKRPLLIPIIVQAWVKHEAYLFIRPNDFPQIHQPLTVRWQYQDESAEISMTEGTRSDQFQFANDLYASVRAGHNLELLKQDSSYTPILTSRAERSAFLATVRDYYRLTERI